MPHILLAFFLMIACTTAHAQEWTDVPEKGQLRVALDALTASNVLDASPLFRPDEDLIRAELAALLARATLKPAYIENFRGSVSFHDIAPNDWFAPSVEALKQSGAWHTGEETRLFSPYRPATRAAFLHALFTMKRENLTAFRKNTPLARDAQNTKAWYFPALAAAVASGFVTPDADNMLHPLEPITRREAALWMYAYQVHTGQVTAIFSSETLRALFAETRAMLGTHFVLP